MGEHFLGIVASPPFFLILLLSNSRKSDQNWEWREQGCKAAQDEAGCFLKLTAKSVLSIYTYINIFI